MRYEITIKLRHGKIITHKYLYLVIYKSHHFYLEFINYFSLRVPIATGIYFLHCFVRPITGQNSSVRAQTRMCMTMTPDPDLPDVDAVHARTVSSLFALLGSRSIEFDILFQLSLLFSNRRMRA